jgi:ppGpp synthetase/RelA/SpoT-type nucleotidyltranferase
MPGVKSLVPGRSGHRNGAANGAATSDPNAKPDVGDEYVAWLEEKIWSGDTRELKEGRFLHQQADLRQAFEASRFWREVGLRLYDWGDAYSKEKEALLYQGAPALPRLGIKPWESFLSRSWRENVHNNSTWPGPPDGGWWLPDNWFERAWDIVRTRFVVRYLDGVMILAKHLVDTARKVGLEAHCDAEAKADGYYAYHVYVRQPFSVAALDYDGRQDRSSTVEIQVMTELAEVISALTHTYYEVRRDSAPVARSDGWDFNDLEKQATEIAQQCFPLEKDIERLREEIQRRTVLGTGRRRRGSKSEKRSRGR